MKVHLLRWLVKGFKLFIDALIASDSFEIIRPFFANSNHTSILVLCAYCVIHKSSFNVFFSYSQLLRFIFECIFLSYIQAQATINWFTGKFRAVSISVDCLEFNVFHH